ncbi:MAG: SDR family NAD(P)-dependent oxidoreductase [bacterium]|nr:SDR family NAD(P)-dependent oxidoreductase [bacterium]
MAQTALQRVALVTGASSGIGYETALAFAKRGVNVVGTARRVDRLRELGERITALPAPHGEFLAVEADVREAAAMQSAVQQTIERFGRLDILVANAGLGQRGGVVDSHWEHLETVVRTNIDGVLHSVRAAVPEMRKTGGGHLILISSVVFNMVGPYMATYAASKAFVSSLAHSLRLELKGDNIVVTDIIVGRTETEFNDKRLGAPRTSKGSGITRVPVQSAAYVAEGIVKAALSKRRTVTLRWYDKLLVLGNALVPDFIGRLSMRQYK